MKGAGRILRFSALNSWIFKFNEDQIWHLSSIQERVLLCVWDDGVRITPTTWGRCCVRPYVISSTSFRIILRNTILQGMWFSYLLIHIQGWNMTVNYESYMKEKSSFIHCSFPQEKFPLLSKSHNNMTLEYDIVGQLSPTSHPVSLCEPRHS